MNNAVCISEIGTQVATQHASGTLNKPAQNFRSTQRQFSENICLEDDLRSRLFGKFVVKFLACLPLLGYSNIEKMV